MRTLRAALSQRVLLTDGSLHRELETRSLDIERDLAGHRDLLEYLSLTRFDRVVDAHRAFLDAGADVVRTNSLRASPLTLKPFGLAEDAFILNYKSAEAAAEAIDSVAGNGRRRFVLGVIRDDGWDAAPGDIEAAVAVQTEGLVAGGADGVILDVLPGIGRIQAILNGALRGRAAAADGYGAPAPIYLQAPSGGRAIGPDTLARCEGLLQYQPGHSDRLDALSNAIADKNPNLVGGGASPADTEILDTHLRHLAEDGFRPDRAWIAENGAIDELAPVSAWRRFPDQTSKSTLETV